MKKSVLIAVLTCLSIAGVNAQNLSFGVKAGINASNLGSDYNDKLGYGVGLEANYNFFEKFFLSTGLEFNLKGGKMSLPIYSDYSPGATLKYNAEYFQVPIHVGYMETLSPTFKIFASVGPYFAYGVGGKIHDLIIIDENSSTQALFFNEFAKRFDMGIGATAGIEYAKHYTLHIGYDYGLLDVGKTYQSFKNRSLYFSLGYRF